MNQPMFNPAMPGGAWPQPQQPQQPWQQPQTQTQQFAPPGQSPAPQQFQQPAFQPQQPAFQPQQPAQQQWAPAPQQFAPAPQFQPQQPIPGQQGYQPGTPAPGQGAPLAMGTDQLTAMLAGVGTASSSGSGIYLQAPGLYVVDVCRCTFGNAQGGFPYFVTELDVKESNHPQLPAGLRAAHMCSLKDPRYKATWLANVKQFVSACYLAKYGPGAPPFASLSENDQIRAIMECGQDAQPYTGVRLRAQSVNITTKQGKTFTKSTFAPYQAG